MSLEIVQGTLLQRYVRLWLRWSVWLSIWWWLMDITIGYLQYGLRGVLLAPAVVLIGSLLLIFLICALIAAAATLLVAAFLRASPERAPGAGIAYVRGIAGALIAAVISAIVLYYSSGMKV